VLFVGDLSYADNYPYHDNVRWDTWARFVERNVAYQPWIWTAGNHEIDFAPELVCSIILYIISYAICFNGRVGSSKSRYSTRAMLWALKCSFSCIHLQGETKPFKPFSHRYPTPYKASGSTAPYWYSIKRASAYIIVLASYSAYGMCMLD
jgi:hypothetical protein